MIAAILMTALVVAATQGGPSGSSTATGGTGGPAPGGGTTGSSTSGTGSGTTPGGGGGTTTGGGDTSTTGTIPTQGATTPGGTGLTDAPTGVARSDAERRLVEQALDAAERAADAARHAVRQSEWAVARAHLDHLHEWLGLATRTERPSGDAAVRWDFAAREARRLDAALMKRDATAARWADAALTLALADARASLAMAGGGGGGRSEPAWDMEVVPDANDPKRVTDPAKKYENVPLERERPWSRGRQW